MAKLIAVFVGASGIGIFGLYTSVLSLITTVADLGISKSSVRNIALAEGMENSMEIEKTISIAGKLIYVTGTIGAFFTIVFAYQISIWTFGDSAFWLSIVLLGVAVFFTILHNGQLAILQGLRKYKLIAKSTMYSALIASIVSVPLIFFFRQDSIIYIILAGAIVAFGVTQGYLKNLPFSMKRNGIRLTTSNSIDMIRLGMSMMLVSFLVSLSGYIVRAYIGNNGTITDLGYFQAGFQIISGYFGVIFTSMTTDYFPRISAIQDDNEKLQAEVNQQATLTLLLICPLVVLLPYIMPYVISILYSQEFSSTVEYVNYALFGIIFQAGSLTMGMILLAKNHARVFTVSVFLFQSLFLVLNLIGYTYYGILGLGLSFSINMLLHLIGVQVMNYVLYKITYNKSFFVTLFIVFAFALTAKISIALDGIFYFLVGGMLVCGSLLFVILKLKKLLNIGSLSNYIKSYLNVGVGKVS